MGTIRDALLERMWDKDEPQKKPRWIAHNQDCMPKRLKPETLVNIYLRCGICMKHVQGEWWYPHWETVQDGMDIIAYQIVGENE